MISEDEQRARVLCLVAAERADVLLEPLRGHFAAELAGRCDGRAADAGP